MSDPEIGAVIVRYIDELEAALRYAHSSMQPALAKAVAGVMQRKQLALNWAGEVLPDFNETLWLAPEEWRMPGGAADNEFYLSFSLDTSPSIDGSDPETWVGIFAGVAGAGMKFTFGTDALGQREWKALLKAQAPLAVELVDKGFRCEPKTGELALAIPIGRQELAMGFEEKALEDALSPLIQAVDRIDAARPVFDRLVESIKSKAPG
jgi:hypothetical protein